MLNTWATMNYNLATKLLRENIGLLFFEKSNCPPPCKPCWWWEKSRVQVDSFRSISCLVSPIDWKVLLICLQILARIGWAELEWLLSSFSEKNQRVALYAHSSTRSALSCESAKELYFVTLPFYYVHGPERETLNNWYSLYFSMPVVPQYGQSVLLWSIQKGGSYES